MKKPLWWYRLRIVAVRSAWAVVRRYRMALWRLQGKPVLPIAAIVSWGVNGYCSGFETWRVESWLREARPNPKGNWMDDILFESCQKINGVRMEWCLPSQATHVSLRGVCGAIAPMGECRFIEMVNWPYEQIIEEQSRAIALGSTHEKVF
jgi:hypothetical protein